MQTGDSLRRLREAKPLVHQITNYVVMNETANATLALGALPVMAHAREEVEEMVAIAGALVLNIGTLSPHWVEAMLLRVGPPTSTASPSCSTRSAPVRRRYRTETAKRLLDEVNVTVLRGNAGEVATLVGVAAEVRGVESIGAGDDPAALARKAGAELGLVASVTGRVDHVSDGNVVVAVANGHPLMAAITGTGCMSSALTGCFLAVNRERPLEAAAEALVAFGVAGEEAARGARVPARFTSRCTTRSRRSIPQRSMRGPARREGARARRRSRDGAAAVAAGATVVQLRVKGPTDEIVERGAGFAELGVTFVVNDDVDAALALGAEGVHLGQDDPGASRARAHWPPARPLGHHARGGPRRGCRLSRRRAGLGDPVEIRCGAAARAWRGSARSAPSSACPWWRSAASTPRTPASASAPARPAWRRSARPSIRT